MNQKICKVLVVDDEFLIRQGIMHFLDWGKTGFTMIGEASNGKEALECIRKETPHIVLCDIVMPVMDGIELAQHIKAEYPSIKIIVLSSYSDFDNVKKMFINGATDYILKPTLNQDNLLQALEKARMEIDDIQLEETSTHQLSFVLNRFLNGYEMEEIQDQEWLNNKSFRLLGIHIYEETNLKQKEEEMKQLWQQLFARNQYCFLASKEDTILCLFDNTIYEHVLNIMKSQNETCIVVSDVFDSIYLLKEVYDLQINKYLVQRFYLKGLFIDQDFKMIENGTITFDMKQFNDYLYTMQLQYSLTYLTTQTLEHLHKQVYEKDLKAFLSNALYSFITILEQHNLKSMHIQDFKLSTLSMLEKSNDVQTFQEEFTKVIENLKIVVDKYQEASNIDMMERITTYIQEHYKESISLYDVATAFNFSYSYLSTYFNERSLLSFNEYLNKIRVHKAADLLKQNYTNISEVGYEVGFSDHSYFCKVFKKIMGVTPSAYRRGKHHEN